MSSKRRKPQRGRIVSTSTTTSLPAADAAVPNRPTNAPAMPETGFMRQPQVLMFVPISKSTLWRRVQAKTFPAPLKLSPRVTVWRTEDIRGWIQAQGVAS
jgi:prophage regulatory protein